MPVDEIKRIKVIRNSLNLEGEWFTFRVEDIVDIELKVRPLLWDFGRAIEDQHKKVKSPKFHRDKKITTNFETFSTSLIDFLLEDFKGFGSAPDKPLDITIENKIKIIKSIKGLTDFVWEKAVELADKRIKECLIIY
jgi:hypothetical protein